MTSLAEVFDGSTVERLAGPRVQARASAYLRDGRVEPASVRAGRLTATVRGTMPYLVQLWAERGRPRWACSCPAAEDGSFCKHCAATALSLAPGGEDGRVRGPARGGRPESGAADGADGADGLADIVAGLSRDRLAAIVLAQAGADWRLRELLLAEAQAEQGTGPDLAAWRSRIDGAFAPSEFSRGGFVIYAEAAGWAAGVDEAIDALKHLCEAGHHDAAARLAEHAHRRADEAVDYVDDSDGWLSGISERLGDLHLAACEAGRPDPVELAGRLVELELTSELDAFYRSATSHAEVLGETGLAAFRERLEPRLGRVTPAGDGWSIEAFAVEQALVGWALGTGDPDALIEAHSRGGISTADALEIARALDGAGRGDEAIVWARRGLDELGGRVWLGGGLRDFLARKLRDRGEERAAVELYWQAFLSHPSLSAYRRLLSEDAGEDWLVRCREALGDALALLPSPESRDCRPGAAFGPLPPAVPGAAGALVEILLYEGLADAAWQVAVDYGCNSQMWLTLARALEAGRPMDSIAVYEQAALAIIDRKKANQYQSAVDLMARVRRLADSAGEPGRFTSLLERVRTEHKAKRKLKSLLDAHGW